MEIDLGPKWVTYLDKIKDAKGENSPFYSEAEQLVSIAHGLTLHKLRLTNLSLTIENTEGLEERHQAVQEELDKVTADLDFLVSSADDEQPDLS